MTAIAAAVNNGDFRFEAARLNSFVGWANEHVEPGALAAAGFYFTGHGDSVKCFDCNIRLRNWNAGDDPLSDHRRFQEFCRFVSGQACGNVPLGTEADAVPPFVPRTRDFAGVFGTERLMREAGAIPVAVYFTAEDPPTSIVYRYLQESKYPEYSIIEERIASFATWPSALTQTKEQLAEAGFYYTQLNDRAQCFYCGLGLEGWEPDDVPLLEHLKWASTCQFALQRQVAAAAMRENATSCA